MRRRLVRAGAVVAVLALLLAGGASWYLFGGAPARDGAANPWSGGPTLVIAHRGGAREAPESTLFAYRSALAAGSDVLEIDLRATADGALVVLHDDDVARTTDGSGEVASMTLAQVRALDAAWSFVPGRGAVPGRPGLDHPYRGVATGQRPPPRGAAAADFRVPTLGEVLTAFPDARLAVEVKQPPTGSDGADGAGAGERELVAQLRAAGRLGDVYVASFRDATLDRVRDDAPGVATAAGPREALRSVLASTGPLPGRRTTAQVLALPADARAPVTGAPVLTRDLVRGAHRHGVAVHVFTVDDPQRMADLVALGVDGIYTDVPSVLARVLAGQPR